MKKILFTYQGKTSSLNIYHVIRKNILLVEPAGFVNPSLVRLDLRKAYEFCLGQERPWIYLVDTSKVIIANPLNLFLLSQIKRLPHLESYVIYAPSLFVRILAHVTRFVIKPQLVLRNPDQYYQFLE